jgi:hypothetical protein
MTTQDPLAVSGLDGPEQDPSVKEKAGDAVAQSKQAAGDVAHTAGEHVAEIKDTAVEQAKDLTSQLRGHVTGQASEQHSNLVNSLRSITSELDSMLERGESGGQASQLVTQARDRVDSAANWLSDREPGELLDELKVFAQRRPGVFLVGALAAGVVAGRLTRGAVAHHTDDSGSSGASFNGAGASSSGGSSTGGDALMPGITGATGRAGVGEPTGPAYSTPPSSTPIYGSPAGTTGSAATPGTGPAYGTPGAGG